MSRKRIVGIVFCTVIAAISLILVACSDTSRGRQLPPPQNLRVEDGELVWSKVQNAVGYEVYLDNAVYETHRAQFDLSDLTDTGRTYVLYVLAMGDGEKYSNSKKVKFSYKPTPDAVCGKQLPSPQDLRVEDGKIVWNEVKNAIGYEVYLGTKVYGIRFARFNLSDFVDPNKNYELFVIALGDGINYLNSEKVKFNYNGSSASTTDFKFRLLDDGSGYEVLKGGARLGERVVIPDSYLGLPVKKNIQRRIFIREVDQVCIYSG